MHQIQLSLHRNACLPFVLKHPTCPFHTLPLLVCAGLRLIVHILHDQDRIPLGIRLSPGRRIFHAYIHG